MCHLRGILMLKVNRSEQAKQCFMEALALDVKCYESFEQLINGEMLMPDEGTLSPSLLPVAFIDDLYRVGIRAKPCVQATSSGGC